MQLYRYCTSYLLELPLQKSQLQIPILTSQYSALELKRYLSDNEQIKISLKFRLQDLSLDSVNCIEIGDIIFMIAKSKYNIDDLIDEDDWNELEEESNYESEYYNDDEDKDYYEFKEEDINIELKLGIRPLR
ncbi:MAG: hypothetical protein EZS28_046931 [Streblomastix strix]|uniref:Uncharacterized protein n=1 Tax=Streblomastix strix TaxID=222440 RepID=A0A5J4TIH2_9EUKA|nr:MAG: hypothetical protein EZS28_046931 [Streblomastix strix]